MKALSSGIAVAILWGTVLLTAQAGTSSVQTVTPREPAADIRIVSLGGKRNVEVMPAGATQWKAASAGDALKPGDRIRTREFSTVQLRWSDKSVVRLPELSDVQIQAPTAQKQPASFSLLQGLLYFFNRERLMNARYGTRTASAAIRGTEFILQAEQNGHTTLTVLEGEVDLSNEIGVLTLKTGEQGVADPGQQPRKIAAIIVNNVIQWALYYPAVLDVDELPLTDGERAALADSLHAYQIGDLLKALDLYPAGRQQTSPAERVYFAGLVLAAGDVEKAEASLDALGAVAGQNRPVSKVADLADALRLMIATVKRQERLPPSSPQLATEWLATSYYQQSTGGLRQALQAAYKSVEIAPKFGYGWARVAELEFSHGHNREMSQALDRAMNYSPMNPYAMTLKGFVHAARNEIRPAIVWFERAIEIDPGLANARLGRGLSLIRRGDTKRGREDLLIAATLEPQRSIFRSYLAKAYTDAGDEERAEHEIQLAKDLDPNDPTAWLYSALLNEQQNRVNQAIRDLEKSQELTGNRRIYRSGLLLDQDRGVGSANLARIYQDAGMFDVAVREAARGVNYDYANYSAHLFLANSYDQLRDPNRINLRYETAAVSEYLIANLLAPVGAGTLSTTISQQEYSKLFERDRLGLVSSTEYLSRGAWVQSGAQYGTFKNSAYAVEASYHTDNGQRINNDFEERILSLTLKQNITPSDNAYVQVLHYDAEGGDLSQYYDPSSANPLLRTRERQEPTLLAGYHREWSPNHHTLLLFARLHDEYEFLNPGQITFVVSPPGDPSDVTVPIPVSQQYRSDLEIYSGEFQHIFERRPLTTILGGRFQAGEFHTRNLQTDPPRDFDGFLPVPAASQDFKVPFHRATIYAYEHWQMADSFRVIAGLSYDWLTYPRNFRAAPISDSETSKDQLSPKAGLIWEPDHKTAVRAAYSRSLGGASFEHSIRLEPTQVAGFNQAFRSIIPESVGGANEGAEFDVYAVSIEHRFPSTRTYIGVEAQLANSEVERSIGTFIFNPLGEATLGQTPERLEYKERAVLLTVNQLVSDQFALAARYRISKADLRSTFPEAPTGVDNSYITGVFRPRQHLEAVLHEVNLAGIYNHPSGLFGQVQALWYLQNSEGYPTEIASEDVWQFNAFAGYRFLDRRIELLVGVLNITDADYRLNPLTLYSELPRSRTLVARFRFSF